MTMNSSHRLCQKQNFEHSMRIQRNIVETSINVNNDSALNDKKRAIPFLVGAFSLKEKSPTLRVSFLYIFFS